MRTFLVSLGVLMILLPVIVSAATYYVSTTGNDNNAGTQALPYKTIQRCANVAQAGDTCYVRAGTYNERVSLSRSGTASAYINFVGYSFDAKPVMRGFNVDANYVRIIGFEITHTTSLSYDHAITLGSSSHIEILNNYIHNTAGEGGAIGEYGNSATYITIRENEIYYAACIPGGACAGNGWGVQSGYSTNHWLVEYNNMHKVGDFIDVYGNHQIVRNNYLHDYSDSYFTTAGNHVDFFQPGSDSVNTHTNNHIYESNVLSDNLEGDSHVLQMRNTVNAGDKEIIFRGNVAYNVGSYALQAASIDYVRLYNNAFYKMLQKGAGNGLPNFRYNVDSSVSVGSQHFNNIMQDIPVDYPSDLFSVEGGCGLTASNNLCYNSGSHSSCKSTINPLFVSTANNDFHLQSGSPAIGLGKAITTVTSSSGSGASFNVADASFFTDGWGIADGDIIKVGSNNPVRITSISSNTITVEGSISWNIGDGVYWRNQDTSPDAGAYEYRSSGYNYGISINSPGNNSGVSGSVNILTMPINPELIRQVIFYIDGVPVSRDFSSPFSFVWNTVGLAQGSSHVIEAAAYPLYATTDLWKSSSIMVTVGAVIQPSPCTDNDWTYSDGPCQSNNNLIRAWAKLGNCQGGSSHLASENISCVYVPPVAVPGDLNGDSKVDIIDLSIVARDFGLNSTNPRFNAGVDVAVDGFIDIADLSFIARRYTG
jgi:hypothetical protein